MILSTLSASERTVQAHPLLAALFDYVRTHDLTAVPAGCIELSGRDLFINVSDVQLKQPGEQKLEVHRAYLDVHIPLSGPETIGWRALEDIDVAPDAPFDTDNDFALYSAPATSYVTVRPGEFLLVYPEDAHAPVLGEGPLRKLVAKLRL